MSRFTKPTNRIEQILNTIAAAKRTARVPVVFFIKLVQPSDSKSTWFLFDVNQNKNHDTEAAWTADQSSAMIFANFADASQVVDEYLGDRSVEIIQVDRGDT